MNKEKFEPTEWVAEITRDDHATIEYSLTNQAPADPNIITFFEMTRGPFKEAAHLIIDLIPPSRERSLALTKIEEALMWAIKAIAVNQQGVLDRAAADGILRKAES